MGFVNPLAGIEYERAWGPGGGTHAFGQNWQSSWGWDLLHDAAEMPVRAPFDGYVKSVGGGGSGRFAGAKVGIEGDTYSCFLTHMSRVTVRLGDRVTAGQVIGTTGQAVGVWHLHFAMCRGPYRSPESAGVDPRPFLDASADAVAPRGPKGYPLYRGHAFKTADAAPPPPPDGTTLRLAIRTSADRHAGRAGRKWAGWPQTEGALRWIKKHGLASDSDVALAWRGNVFRGPRRVEKVAATLVNRFLD